MEHFNRPWEDFRHNNLLEGVSYQVERYDFDNASSLAPSDADVTRHYNATWRNSVTSPPRHVTPSSMASRTTRSTNLSATPQSRPQSCRAAKRRQNQILSVRDLSRSRMSVEHDSSSTDSTSDDNTAPLPSSRASRPQSRRSSSNGSTNYDVTSTRLRRQLRHRIVDAGVGFGFGSTKATERFHPFATNQLGRSSRPSPASFALPSPSRGDVRGGRIGCRWPTSGPVRFCQPKKWTSLADAR